MVTLEIGTEVRIRDVAVTAACGKKICPFEGKSGRISAIYDDGEKYLVVFDNEIRCMAGWGMCVFNSVEIGLDSLEWRPAELFPEDYMA